MVFEYFFVFPSVDACVLIHDENLIPHYQCCYSLYVSWLDFKYRINATISVNRSIDSSISGQSNSSVEIRIQRTSSLQPRRVKISDCILCPKTGLLKIILEHGDH